MGMYSVGAALENLWWDIKMIPMQVEIAYKSDKYMREHCKSNNNNNNATSQSQKASEPTSREEKKHDDNVMKMAKESAESDRKEDFTPSVENYIIEVTKDSTASDFINRVTLVNKAIETNKLIQFAMFYMTDDRADLIKRPQIEREIINGIAALFNFGKIYPNDGVSSLKMYDPEYEADFCNTCKFILSICDIAKKLNDPVFVEKMMKRKEQLAIVDAKDDSIIDVDNVGSTESKTEESESKNNSRWQTDADGIIHPVFFTEDAPDATINNETEEVVKPQYIGLTDDEIVKLEEAFGTATDAPHRFEKTGDLINMYISRNNYGDEDVYLIDPGIIMGSGKYYVMATTNVNGDTIFVSSEHNDIVKNILSSKFYILTPEECQIVFEHYFRNMVIYRYIDMSNTEFLNSLSREDFEKLGKKLSYILNTMSKNNNTGNDLPRMRFNYWNGVDDFIIISDPDVKSPIPDTGKVIMEGLMFQVNGDDVSQRINNQEVYKYHISKYGDM